MTVQAAFDLASGERSIHDSVCFGYATSHPPQTRSRHDFRLSRSARPYRRAGAKKACSSASNARSTRTPKCTRWCAGNSAAEFRSAQRKAFLFENVTDSNGRRYDIPVAVGILASNREIYGIGIGCDVDRHQAEMG